MDKSAQLRPFCLAKILYDLTNEDHSLTTHQLMSILEEKNGIKTHCQTVPSDGFFRRCLDSVEVSGSMAQEK